MGLFFPINAKFACVRVMDAQEFKQTKINK